MMTASTITAPKFSTNQTVQFIGGEGKIKGRRPGSSSWTYLVEMALGPEPDMGRVGHETTVLLNETDIEPIS